MIIGIAAQDSAVSYQWYQDGIAISGATSNTYAVSIFALSDTGVYVCRSIGTALEYPSPMNYGPGTTYFVSEPILVTGDQTSCTTGAGCEDGKVEICHVPPGNPSNSHTICVSPNAVAAHLAHGDYLGSCDGNETNPVNSSFITLNAAPNPFSGQTTISYYLPEDADVMIQLINVHGNVEGTPVEGFIIAGDNEFTFNVDVNGVYFVVMTINGTDIYTERLISIQ